MRKSEQTPGSTQFMKAAFFLIFLLSASNIPAEDPSHVVITGIELPTESELQKHIKMLNGRFVVLNKQLDDRKAKIDTRIEIHPTAKARIAREMLKVAGLTASSAFLKDYISELNGDRGSLVKVVAEKKEATEAMEKAIRDADASLDEDAKQALGDTPSSSQKTTEDDYADIVEAMKWREKYWPSKETSVKDKPEDTQREKVPDEAIEFTLLIDGNSNKLTLIDQKTGSVISEDVSPLPKNSEINALRRLALDYMLRSMYRGEIVSNSAFAVKGDTLSQNGDYSATILRLDATELRPVEAKESR
jgi:hypothetical protein